MAKRRIIGRLLLACGTLIFCNLVAGFIVQDRYVHLDVVDSRAAASSFGYFLPNQRKRVMFIGIPPYRVTIDSLGLRLTKPIPASKTEGKYRILCIGDSLTFGLFVDDEAAYPYLLQQRLDRLSGRFEVLNAGIGNISINDEVYYLEKVGLKLKPDLVILYFSPNDFQGMRERVIPYYEQAQIDGDRESRGLGCFVHWLKSRSLYRLFTVFEVRYKYQRFLAKLDDPEIRRIYRQHSQKPEDLVKMGRHHLDPVAANPTNPAFESTWKRYFAYLDEFHRLTQANQARLLVVIYPEFLEIMQDTVLGYNEILMRHLEQKNIPCLDLRPAFKAHRADLLRLYNDPPQDFHLSREGNALLAGEIEQFLSRENIL